MGRSGGGYVDTARRVCQFREYNYRLWEEKGRSKGLHLDHWQRAADDRVPAPINPLRNVQFAVGCNGCCRQILEVDVNTARSVAKVRQDVVSRFWADCRKTRKTQDMLEFYAA
ncbi:DUF2934 domain-containing protein [Rhizobium sp. SYY.PMSO]|uniref:DUF2934 domain-containing protein n=1 Tax=Rhizobium sp. SYY.PMSO TaxID=3382192 RepID=UPI0013AFC66D